MKKIIILGLVLLSFGINYSSAGYSKSVEEKDISSEASIREKNYDKYYKLSREVRELVNKYYYAMVFEKDNANEIYSKALSKFEEYKKIAKIIDGRYYREILFKDFIRNPNTDNILRELGYSKIYYDSYSDSTKSTFFTKEHNIDLSKFKLNDKIDGIYLGMTINRIEKKEFDYNSKGMKLPTFKENYLRNIYIKHNSKEINFKKIDLKNFNGKININVLKLVKDIKKDERINVSINFFLKKGDSYIGILRYPIYDRFSFSEYDIKSSFEQKFIKENDPSYNRYGYRENTELKNKLNEKLNEKLSIIFDKIKKRKTEKEYLLFLKGAKNRIISFNNDSNKYKDIASGITDEKTYNNKYNKFVKIKNKEKIINLLLVFISEEIYKNELETTISDFIK